ncbi:MAG: T9SS type B sorting domain-containing protein [Saprospiraceae bacterium]|nr:T9SS type B sorting domain-containing protein [Saprospiraceae bacterium]
MLKKLIFVVLILNSFPNSIYTQFSVDIGCQNEGDAIIGLDRKAWTSDIDDVSESYQLDFMIPENMPFSCTVLDRVEVTINGYSATNNIDPTCYLWLYTHALICDDHTPISCSEIIYDQQGLSTFFTLDGEDVPEGSTLGVDIVVVVDRTNLMCIPDNISQGFYDASFEICLEAFYVPDEPEEYIDLGDDIEICPDEQLVLEGPDDYLIYEWEGPIDSDEQNVENAIPGLYTLEVTDDNGCRSSDDIEIIPIVLEPIITDQPDSIASCTSSLINIEVLNYTDMSQYDIEWLDITGDDLASGNSYQPTISGDYIIEVTELDTDCTVSDTINVNIIMNAPASIAGDIAPCEGSEVILYNQFGQNPSAGYNFEWVIGGDTLTSDTIMINAVQDSIFLILSDSLGCGASSDTLLLMPSVAETAGADNSYNGCVGEMLDLISLVSAGASTNGSWIDNNGNPIPSMINLNNPNTTATYFYVISNIAPCPNDTASFQIFTSDSDVNAGMDNFTTVCPEESINLESFVSGDTGGYFEDSNNQLIADPNILANELMPGLNTFQYIIQSANCGSDTAEVNITVLDEILPTVIDDSLCPDDFITIDAQVYDMSNASGDEIIMASNGCDSLIMIDLSFYQSADTLISTTLCEDEIVIIGGVTFDNTFTQDQILLSNASVNGCDSLIDVNLSFVSAIDTLITGTFCDDETIIIEGITFDLNNSNDQIILANGSAAGCDSIINVDFTFEMAIEENITGMYCPDEVIVINGNDYNINNDNGTENLMSSSGCDSIINIDLDFFPLNEQALNLVLCDDESIQIGNDIYDRNSLTGTTILPDTDINGCDSILNISVDHRLSTSFDQSFEICETDSVFVNGMWVNYSDTFTETLINNAGCDSVVTSIVSVINCAITVQLASFDESCFEENNGTLEFQIEDTNQFPLNYILTNAAGQTVASGPISGPIMISVLDLSPDDYSLNIEKDGTIVTSESFTINPASSISVTSNVEDADCFGESTGSITVDAVGGNGMLSYSWSTGSSANNITDIPAGLYTLIVQDENGCVEEFIYTVGQAEDLNYDLILNDPNCANDATGSIEISVISGGTTPFTYFVNGVASQSPIFSGLAAGQYDISIEDNNGCTFASMAALATGNLLEVQLPQSLTINLGDSEFINAALNFQPSTILWSPADGLSCSDCPNPTITPMQSTVYTFYAEDENGCFVEAELTVNVDIPQTPDVYVPNIFNPSSNDGINNRFQPFPNESKGVEIKSLSIFDRWGNIVFEEFGNFPGWTGFINGTPASQGVYMYQLSYSVATEEKTELGHFTLVR